MKKIIPLLLMILLTIPSASAQLNTTQYCMSNNVTLRHLRWVNIDVNPINISRQFYVTEDEICQYGCRSNQCTSPPYIIYGIIFALVVGAACIYLFIRPR